MPETETKAIPTVEEVRADCLRTRNIIVAYSLSLDATIDDYPIGRSDRGKCRLQVERVKNKGYRTVRTTTDRNGRWCAPKKSTFRGDVLAVVSGLGGDRDVRWLGAGGSGVYLQSANGHNDFLVEAPYFRRPRREEHGYSVMHYVGADAGTAERHVIPADPTALCDAYEEWLVQIQVLRALVLEAWNA